MNRCNVLPVLSLFLLIMFMPLGGHAQLIQWNRQFGTNTWDDSHGVAVDPVGNIYVVGQTTGSLSGNVSIGGRDIFIAKYDTSGVPIWVRQFGTTENDGGFSIAIDSQDNIYIIGYTEGSFPGYLNSGGYDLFVAKYSSAGVQLWLEQTGTSGFDFGEGLSIDSLNNIYVTGVMGDRGFIAKYASSGAQTWLKQFGESFVSSNGVSVSPNDDVYVTGYTNNSFPGYAQQGIYDAFIIKYDALGNQVWLKQFGTDDIDNAAGISTDRLGNVYVTGYTYSSFPSYINPTPHAGDIFVTKYDSSGNQVWLRQLEKSGDDVGINLGIGVDENIYVTGYIGGDTFLAAYDPLGNQIWLKQFGTDHKDTGTGIGIDSSNNIYVGGFTEGAFPGNTNAGEADIFITKISPVMDVTPPTVSIFHNPASPTTSEAVNFTVTASDDVGVQDVKLYIDDTLKQTWTQAGTFTYNAGTFTAGTHTYYTVATDIAGNSTRAPITDTKSFNVQSASCFMDDFSSWNLDKWFISATAEVVAGIGNPGNALRVPGGVGTGGDIKAVGVSANYATYEADVYFGSDAAIRFYFAVSDENFSKWYSVYVGVDAIQIDKGGRGKETIHLDVGPGLSGNTWYNVKVVRDIDNSIKVYFNGSSNPTLSAADSDITTDGLFSFGVSPGYTECRIDNVSVVPIGSGSCVATDTTPPTVSVTHSPSSPTASSLVTFAVAADDDGGIQKVELFVDDVLKKTWTSGGTLSYDAGTFTEGTHTYYAVATDTAGNTARDPETGTKSFSVSTETNISACGSLSIAGGRYTLIQDVSSSGTCFNITAANVTLDCNGFKIQGNGSGDGVFFFELNNITVKNCDISNFGNGIREYGGGTHTITNNTISNSQYGILMQHSVDSVISGNTLRDTSYPVYGGVMIWGGQKVQNNTITTTSGCITPVSNLQFYPGNTYNGQLNVATFCAGNYTISNLNPMSNMTLDCNGATLKGNGTEDGIFFWQQNNITVKNCTLSNYTNGIREYGGGTHNITANDISDSSNGIYLTHSNNSVLTGNRALNNSTADIACGFSAVDGGNNVCNVSACTGITCLPPGITLRIVDQLGNDLPSAKITVPGKGTFSTPANVELAPGDYTFTLQPDSNASLTRTETRTVTAATTELVFEWKTATFPVKIVDQNATLFPDGSFFVTLGGTVYNWSPNNTTITLPTNDKTVYPTIQGSALYSFNVNVLPGGSLYRVENEVIPPTITEKVYEWKTATFPVKIVDQTDVVIPGSEFYITLGSTIYNWSPSGTTVTLPINDKTVYTAIQGSALYTVGMSVVAGGSLYRTESATVFPSTAQLIYPWIIVTKPIAIVNGSGQSVAGSKVTVSQVGTFNSCDTVSLPITDETVYPTMTSGFKNGYPMTLYPGDIAPQSGNGQFEIFSNGNVTPDFISVSGNQYGVRLDAALCVPPPQFTLTVTLSTSTKYLCDTKPVELLVTLLDTNNNSVANEPLSFTVQPVAAGKVTFPFGNRTNGQGQLKVYYTSSGGTPGNVTVTATATNLGVSSDVVINQKAGPPSRVVASSEFSVLRTDGKSPSASSVSASLYDCYNNSVGDYDISFYLSGPGTLSPTAARTNGSGVASTSYTAGSTTGTATITVLSNNIRGTASISLSGAATTLSSTAQPKQIKILESAQVTGVVKDAAGVFVPGETLEFKIKNDIGSFDAVSPILSTTVSTSDRGEATTTFFGLTKSGLAEISVMDTAIPTLSTTLQIPVLAGLATNITLTASPPSVSANNSDFSTLKATVKDAYNNPISGHLLDFSVSDTSFGKLSNYFLDTFTEPDGPASGWQALTGNWQVQSQEYVQTDIAGGIATTGSTSYTDYTVEGRIKFLSNSLSGSVLLRYNPIGRTGYVAGFAADRVYISMFSNFIGGDVASVPYTFIKDTYYSFKATVTGNTISVSVNGQSLVTWTNTIGYQIPSRAKGQIALLSPYNSPIAFDDIKLTVPQGSTITNDMGEASVTFVADGKAGTETVTAKDLSSNPVLFASADIQVLAPLVVTLTADPDVLKADGISSSHLTAKVVDKLTGNPAQSEPVSFTKYPASFVDTFTQADGNAAKWTPLLGTWKIEGNEYSGAGNGTHSVANASLFDDNSTDYIYHADFNVQSGSGPYHPNFGLLLRYADVNNFVSVSIYHFYGTPWIAFYVYENGFRVRAGTPLYGNFKEGSGWHKLIVKDTGSLITISVDGTEYLKNYPYSTNVPSGKKGLTASYLTHVHYDNVLVYSPQPDGLGNLSNVVSPTDANGEAFADYTSGNLPSQIVVKAETTADGKKSEDEAGIFLKTEPASLTLTANPDTLDVNRMVTFTKDFNDGSASGFTFVPGSGTWQVEQGELSGTGTVGNDLMNVTYFLDDKERYIYALDFEVKDGSGPSYPYFGAYLRWQDENNWVRVDLFGPAPIYSLRFIKREAGTYITYQTVGIPSYAAGTGKHHLSITDTGKDITAALDERVYLQNFPYVTVVPYGKKGMFVNGFGHIHFDNVSVFSDNPESIAMLTAKLLDSSGQPVPFEKISLTALSELGSLADRESVTDLIGEIRTQYIASNRSGSETIRATESTVPLTADASLVVKPGPPRQMTISAARETIKFGEQTEVIISLFDVFNNPVVGDDVIFSFDGSSGSLSTSRKITDENGQAVVAFTAGNTPGVATITVSETLDSQRGEFQIHILGPPDKVTVLPNPDTVTVKIPGVTDGKEMSVVSVLVTDVNGAPISGETITFNPPKLGAIALQGQGSDVTDKDGKAYFVYTAGDKSGTELLQANNSAANLLSDLTKITVKPGPPTELKLAASPETVTADGASVSDIQVDVLDAKGNLVPEQEIQFTLTTFDNSIYNISTTYDPTIGYLSTDAAFSTWEGVAKTTFTSSKTAAQGKITAQYDNEDVHLSTELALKTVPGIPDKILGTAVSNFDPSDGNVLEANGTDTAKVDIRIVDANDNLIPNLTLDLALKNSISDLGALSSGAVVTQSDPATYGSATVTYTAGGQPGYIYVEVKTHDAVSKDKYLKEAVNIILLPKIPKITFTVDKVIPDIRPTLKDRDFDVEFSYTTPLHLKLVNKRNESEALNNWPVQVNLIEGEGIFNPPYASNFTAYYTDENGNLTIYYDTKKYGVKHTLQAVELIGGITTPTTQVDLTASAPFEVRSYAYPNIIAIQPGAPYLVYNPVTQTAETTGFSDIYSILLDEKGVPIPNSPMEYKQLYAETGFNYIHFNYEFVNGDWQPSWGDKTAEEGTSPYGTDFKNSNVLTTNEKGITHTLYHFDSGLYYARGLGQAPPPYDQFEIQVSASESVRAYIYFWIHETGGTGGMPPVHLEISASPSEVFSDGKSYSKIESLAYHLTTSWNGTKEIKLPVQDVKMNFQLIDPLSCSVPQYIPGDPTSASPCKSGCIDSTDPLLGSLAVENDISNLEGKAYARYTAGKVFVPENDKRPMNARVWMDLDGGFYRSYQCEFRYENEHGTLDNLYPTKLMADTTIDLLHYNDQPAYVEVVDPVTKEATLVADNESMLSVTALVTDIGRWPAKDVPVNYRALLNDGTVTPTPVLTNAGGFSSSLYKTGVFLGKDIVRTQLQSFNFDGAQIEKFDEVNITLTPGKVKSLEISADPQNLMVDSGNDSTVTVIALDALGRAVPDVNVSFAFSPDTNGSLKSVNTVTTSEGKASAVYTTGNLTGTITVTATATGDNVEGGSASSEITIEIRAGPPDKLVISANPSVIKADGTSTSELNVAVTDQWGNVIPNALVTFSLAKGIGRFQPESSVSVTRNTDANGEISLTYRSTSASGTETVVATAGSDTNPVSASTTINQQGTPSKIILTSGTSSLVANGTAATSLVGQLLDSNNMPVVNQDVEFAILSGSGVLSPHLAATDEKGNATVSYTSGTLAGAVSTKATLKNTSITDNLNLTLLPDLSTAVLSVAALPSSLSADGISISQVTAELKDVNNNPISGALVYFSVTQGSGSIETKKVTDSSGRAQAMYTSGTQKGSVGIKAEDSLTGKIATTTIMLTPGASTSLALVVDRFTLPADGMTPALLTTQVLDANGNSISGETIEFYANGMKFAEGVSDSDGIVNASYTATTTLGVVELKAVSTSTGISSTAFLEQTATTLTLVATPDTMTAGDVTPSVIAATLSDDGTPIEGHTVTWEKLSGPGTFEVSTTTTNSSGQAYARLFAGTTAGIALVQVKDASYLPEKITTLSIPINPGPLSNFIVAASKQTIVANDVDSSVISATLTDNYGNALSGVNVSFTLVSGLGTLSAALAVTDNSGVAQATLTGKKAGQVDIRVRVEDFSGFEKTVSVNLIAGPPKGLTVWADPIRVEAGSFTPVYVYARLNNGNNNPIAGMQINFSIVSGTGEVFALSDITDAQGLASGVYFAANASVGIARVQGEVSSFPTVKGAVDINVISPVLQVKLYPANPGTFNPQAQESVVIPYEISKDATVTVKIYDKGTSALVYVIGTFSEKAGVNSKVWSGQGGVTSGKHYYYYEVTGVDSSGNTVTVNSLTLPNSTGLIQIDNSLPVIYDVSDAPDPFAVGQSTGISYRITQPRNFLMRVTIDIKDTKNALVKTLNGTNFVGTVNAVSWDGTSSSGASVSLGIYKYIINSVENKNGTKLTANPVEGVVTVYDAGARVVVQDDVRIRYVSVSTEPVTVTKDPVVPDDVTRALLFKGAFGSYLLSPLYQIEPHLSSFTPPAVMSFNYAPSLYGISLALYKFDESVNDWVLVPDQVVDSANHQIIVPIPSASYYAILKLVDDVPPVISNLAVTPSAITPDSDGVNDEAVISYTLSDNVDRSIPQVFVTVRDTSDQIVRSLVSGGRRALGENQETWDGLDDSGLTVNNGVYSIRLDATDASGNNAATQIVNVTVGTVADTEPPTAISDLQTNIINGTQAQLSWSGATDNVGVVRYKVLRMENEPITNANKLLATILTNTLPGNTRSYLDTTTEAGKTYYYAVTSFDAAGNESALSNSPYVIIPSGQPDTTPPVITITFPQDGSTLTDKNITVQAMLSDDLSGVDPATIVLKADDVSYPFNYNVDTGVLTYVWHPDIQDGVHTVTIDAKDRAGNSASQARVSFTLDTVQPQITNIMDSPDPISPGNSPGVKDTATISATVNDVNPDTWGLTITSAQNATVQSVSGSGSSISYNWIGNDPTGAIVTDGLYTYTLNAQDKAGNISTGISSGSVAVDNTSPTSFIDIHGEQFVQNNQTYIAGTTQVSIRGDDPVVNGVSAGVEKTEYAVDAGYLQEYIMSFTLPEGLHTVRHRAQDFAGNIGVEQFMQIYVDNTSPTTTLQPAPKAFTNIGTYTLSASDTVNNQVSSGVRETRYKVDGGFEQVYTGTSIVLSDGYHVVEYFSRDNVGNEEQHHVVTFTVDKTKPQVTNVSDAPDPFSPGSSFGVKDTNTIFASVSDVNPDTWQLQLFDSTNNLVQNFYGNGSFISQTWNGNLSIGGIAPDGLYSYSLLATDKAGNMNKQTSASTTRVLLQDDFDSPTVDTGKWSINPFQFDPGLSVTQENGKLRVVGTSTAPEGVLQPAGVLANVSGDVRKKLNLSVDVDMSNSQASLPEGKASFSLVLLGSFSSDLLLSIYMAKDQGNYELMYMTPTQGGTFGSVPAQGKIALSYDPTTSRMEVSFNGEKKGDVSLNIQDTAVAALAAGGSSGTYVDVRFDNFLFTEETEVPPPLQITDNFDDGILNESVWDTQSYRGPGNFVVEEKEGTLQLSGISQQFDPQFVGAKKTLSSTEDFTLSVSVDLTQSVPQSEQPSFVSGPIAIVALGDGLKFYAGIVSNEQTQTRVYRLYAFSNDIGIIQLSDLPSPQGVFLLNYAAATKSIDVFFNGNKQTTLQTTLGDMPVLALLGAAGNIGDSVVVKFDNFNVQQGSASPAPVMPDGFVKVDNTNPTTALDISGASFTQNNETFISGATHLIVTADDTVVNGVNAGIEKTDYAVDDGSFQNYITPFALPEGIRTVHHKATDNAGNFAEQQTSLKVDTTAPVTTLSPMPEAFTNVFDYTLSAVDPVSNGVSSSVKELRYTVDGGPEQIAVGDVPLHFTGGAHTVEYFSTDNVNNTEQKRTVTFTVDNIPPVVKDVSDAPDPFSPGVSVGVKDTNTISATLEDASDVTWQVGVFDASNATAQTFNGSGKTIQQVWDGKNAQGNFVGDGLYSYSISATDTGGNRNKEISATAVDGTIVVDKTNPVSSLTPSVSLFNNQYASTSATYTVTADDPIVNSVNSGIEKIEYRIQESEVRIFTQPFTLEEGKQVIQHFATDNAGNAEEEKTFSVNVDGTVPVTTLTPSAELFNNIYAPLVTTYALSATDPVSHDVSSGVMKTVCKVDGGAETQYSSAISLTEGEHTLTYFSKDNVLNTEAEKTFTVKVDNTAPVTQLVPSAPLFADKYAPVSTTYTFLSADAQSFGVASGVSKIEYTLDGGVTNIYNGNPITLTEGIHTFTFFATDNVGNKEEAKTFTVHVDNTAPVAQISTGMPQCTEDGKVIVSATTQFTITANDPESNNVSSGVKEIIYRIQNTEVRMQNNSGIFTLPANIPDGEVTIEFAASDNVENGSTAQRITVILDTTPPVAQILSPQDKSVINNTIAVMGMVTDSHFNTGNGEQGTENSGGYTVSFGAGQNPGTFTDIATGTTQNTCTAQNASCDPLTTWSTTSLTQNTLYTLKLSASDCVGNSTTTQVLLRVGDPEFALSFGERGSHDSNEDEFKEPVGTTAFTADDNTEHLLTSDKQSHQVKVFDGSGNYLTLFGDAPQNKLNKPTEVATDAAKNIYVVDSQNGRVVKFDKSYVFQTAFGALNRPYGIMLDTQGNLYITDAGNNRVVKLDTNGNILKQWTGIKQIVNNQEQTTAFSSPAGVAVDSQENVYVVDSGSNRVLKFAQDGMLLRFYDATGITQAPVPNGSTPLSQPMGLTLDSYGNLYVADSENDRVQKFDPWGNRLLNFGTTGTGNNPPDGTFHETADVALDVTTKFVYVTDVKNHRVQKFAVVIDAPIVAKVASTKNDNKNTIISDPNFLNVLRVFPYPSPTHGKMSFNLEVEGNVTDVTLEVYTINGKRVLMEYLLALPAPASKGKGKYKADSPSLDAAMESLPNGVYVYRLQISNGVKTVNKTGKFVVVR